MKKLILRCGLAPGDIVMLTAAVRDLHRCYPRRFATDVRTVCPELWEHNPHITELPEDEPGVEELECSYPLINRCNETPYHCLHGFIEFFNTRLGLNIKPTAFKGDIHLSAQERWWFSQVHELTREPTPFWIISAGGKYDVTIKWWETRRYQQVVNHFRGRIQFVQIGREGHHHPKLDGVIDLRGKTNLRELVRLVYHSQGVLCSVTGLMHLAAAVENPPGRKASRACVVVAGGREPAHWEAYPEHQFIHTNGALPCCAKGGCWRDRTVPLRDGDKRDQPHRLCVDVRAGLPHCMALITAQEVIRRIELYFNAGLLKYLTLKQARAAQRGVRASEDNRFDKQRLNLHNAGSACEAFIRAMPAPPAGFEGRGIVICGGGIRYFTSAWVCIHMLRRLGCRLPIQLWHLGEKEMDAHMKALVTPLGVECVDACALRKIHPVRSLQGWELKPFALVHSVFREVLLLDADNVPVMNPEFLFETKEFLSTGAVFWPDFDRGKSPRAAPVWRSCGLRRNGELEFESGQIVVDKARRWRALRLSLWFNEQSDFYYQYLHGDKETFHLAFRKLRQPYALVPKPIHALPGTMCQHDFNGRRIFQHRNNAKWDLLHNRRVKDFWFERECLADVAQLRKVWNGGLAPEWKRKLHAPVPFQNGSLKLAAVMISCPERKRLRGQTLARLAETDWGDAPVHVQLDQETSDDRKRRQTRCAFLALKRSLSLDADYILFLEDDLEFNRHLRHNLQHWAPIQRGLVTLAGLYNPRLRESACDVENRARLVASNSIFGSQAFLLSRRTVRFLVQHWREAQGLQDLRMSRLAGRLGRPLLYHAPSLVQHVGRASLWGGIFHQAMDFDPEWKAPVLQASRAIQANGAGTARP
jgi:ADP-heptose:LPS heptosyltransferase